MNSLNILSARVSPPQTPNTSRNSSFADVLSATISEKRKNSRAGELENEKLAHEVAEDPSNEGDYSFTADEKTPLLEKGDNSVPRTSGWSLVPNRIANALLESLRWILSTLAAPGIYLIGYLYDDQGQFAPLSQLGLRKRRPISPIAEPSSFDDSGLVARAPVKSSSRRNTVRLNKSMAPSSSSSSGLSSDSESERDRLHSPHIDSPARHTRSKSSTTGDEIAPARRSIRIKLHNEDSLRQRKHRKAQSTGSQSNGSGAKSDLSTISPATLKSPTSPASSLLMTKYPRAPAPPRPLLPRRQPSYSNMSDSMTGGLTQKTLIIDLDETLIHSMAKGGRMSTGHMVEVKLNTYAGLGGQANAGPQHPILYYVHKRPHCDDFLRRVSLLIAFSISY